MRGRRHHHQDRTMRYQLLDNFLSQSECNTIISLAKPELEPSRAYNQAGELKVNESRKSFQTFIPLLANPLIASIEKKISHITNTPIENGEFFQIVYYEKGGFYAAHHDDYQDNSPELDSSGHRIITFMIYLNDVIGKWGDTYFHNLDLSVQPKAGMALWWYNMLEDGKTKDNSTMHSARPTPCDKWIMTKWIRESVAI